MLPWPCKQLIRFRTRLRGKKFRRSRPFSAPAISQEGQIPRDLQASSAMCLR